MKTYTKNETYIPVDALKEGLFLLSKTTNKKEWVSYEDFEKNFTSKSENNYIVSLQESLKDIEILHNIAINKDTFILKTILTVDSTVLSSKPIVDLQLELYDKEDNKLKPSSYLNSKVLSDAEISQVDTSSLALYNVINILNKSIDQEKIGALIEDIKQTILKA
jgi:hypothetical protein